MLPKHVFLSYSTEDLERARLVVDNLEQTGWSVWWDRERISPGDRYRSQIDEALRTSACAVVLWSRHALASRWVTDEAEAAHQRGVLVPVLLEDVDPPLGFRGLRSARLMDWTGASDHPELVSLHRAIASHAGTATQRSQALEEAYFSEQRDIIEEHTRRFVGRGRAIQAVERFLKTNDRGYFLIRGGPGQGKTALAARIVTTLAPVHHFVDKGTYRAEPRLLVRSLLAQLAVERRQLPDNAEALTKLLHDWLALTARSRRVILVIDAIDELPQTADALAFLLLNPLPRNVFIIVTGRPGDAADRVQEHSVTTPIQAYDLDLLDDSEIGAILQAERPAMPPSQMDRITRAVRGNPLLLRAVIADASPGGLIDTGQLPAGVEGYFRRALGSIGETDGPLVRRILGLLAVARRPLSLAELGQITGVAQRDLDDRAVRPLRPYLFGAQRQYRFYHALFSGFVTQAFLYGDEIVRSHRDLATWLTAPDCLSPEYRSQSLAYHLYNAGDHRGLTAHIDADFLGRKVRELGYAVLEDVELLSRSSLDTGDPRQLERCIAFVRRLPEIVGEEIVDQTRHRVRGLPRHEDAIASFVTPQLPSAVHDLEMYAAILPRGTASADFVELFVANDRLFAIIGDAPGIGFGSAFVARFLANVTRAKIQAASFDLGRALGEVRRTVESHELFHSVTMQLVEIDPLGGIAAICNAGHPYPVKYSTRGHSCTTLPVQGPYLNPILNWSYDQSRAARHVEMDPGDALVLYTDGLTDAPDAAIESEGYSFTHIVRASAPSGATAIGQAILRDWVKHFPHGGGDDVALVVISRRSPSTTPCA
jgi:Stage II sporulation protein E (SpoIIE)/TIR domain/NACHT domain